MTRFLNQAERTAAPLLDLEFPIALANDPAIILADEPTGNLDSATGVQIMELLQRLNQQGKTILTVTHEPEIAAYAGAQLYMRDGRIERVEGEQV